MIKLISFSLAILLCCSSALAQKNSTPNIILVFMDDMGNGDWGVTGALEYPTTGH